VPFKLLRRLGAGNSVIHKCCMILWCIGVFYVSLEQDSGKLLPPLRRTPTSALASTLLYESRADVR